MAASHSSIVSYSLLVSYSLASMVGSDGALVQAANGDGRSLLGDRERLAAAPPVLK